MLASPPTVYDGDLFPEPSLPNIEAGFIGWDDEDDHAELGTESDDGNTLVKVTLISGGYLANDDGTPSGNKILCQLSGYPFFCIPPKGARCLVAFPGSFRGTPGAGVIIACPQANPMNQFSKTKAKLDVGADRDLVLKGRSVTLTTHSPEGGPEDFISISPEGGIQAIDRTGNGYLVKDGEVVLFVAKDGDAKTIVRLTKTALELIQKTSSDKTTLLSIASDVITFLGKSFRSITGTVALGKGALPAGTVLTGQTGPSAVPSKSVFISLV